MTGRPLRELAEFAATTSLAEVPSEVTEIARLSLTDTLGCMLGGSTVDPLRSLASSIDQPRQRTRIVGTPFRTHPYQAAFVGGIAGTWMDADSGGTKHPAGGRVPPVPTAHPAVHVLPALLAEVDGTAPLSGQELLRIYLLSHEVGARIGSATRLVPGIHPHGVHGTSSAALAAGLARGASPEGLACGMELGTLLPLMTSLHVAMSGSTVRNAYAGIGARNGLLAVDAVSRGISAPVGSVNPLLGDSVLSDALDEARLLGGLGIEWESTRAYIKPHACARWIHPALDAIASLIPSSGLDAEDVAAIKVRTFRFAAMMNDPHPATDLGGKFSVPYSVASMVCYGRVELEAFTPAAMSRRDLLSLAERVEVIEDAEYTAALPERRPTDVVIQFRDGRTATAAVEGARGDPEEPLSADELEGKFLRLATAAIGPEKARQTLGLLRQLPELESSEALLDSLVP